MAAAVRARAGRLVGVGCCGRSKRGAGHKREVCRERSTGHGFWKMKSRILEGRGRLAGHEYWKVVAQKQSRILRGMAASFVREVGHGFGCDGARKVNEHAVLEVSVACWETVGSVAGGRCAGRGFWARQGSKGEQSCGIGSAGGMTGGRPVLIRSWVRTINAGRIASRGRRFDL